MARLVGKSSASGRDNAAEVTDSGALKVDIGSATLNVTADGVEIKNDAGNPIPVSDNGSSLTVDGRSGSPVVTFTRPADTTPYGAADVIGSASTANHEATNAGSSGSLIQILSASLTLNATSVPSGLTTVRLHIWDSAPAAIADNAVFAASAADRAKYCGFIDMAAIQAIGGGFCWTQGDYIGRPVRLSGTSFFFNIAMTGAAGHTPASGVEFRVRFHCVEAGA